MSDEDYGLSFNRKPVHFRGSGPAFCQSMLRNSERNLPPQLPESGLVRGSSLAEISIRKIHVDAAVAKVHIVCPVEEVEDFKPDLEIDSFRDTCVLVDVDTCLNKVRPAELHRLLVPSLPKGRNGEVALRNCPSKPSLIVG